MIRNPIRRTATRLIPTALLASVALLGGCVSFGAKVPDQLISLTPQSVAPAGSTAEGALADALMVFDPHTDRRIDVLRVPVQISDASVAYLKNAQWVERPTRQFRHLLAETIRAKHPSRIVVEGDDAHVIAKEKLMGRLLDLGYDARNRSVVVRFEAMRQIGAGAATMRRFEAVVPGVAPDAQSVAPALNRAANDVARQVADWMG